MKSKTIATVAVAVAVVLMMPLTLWCSGGPVIIKGEPVTLKIVDAETKEPIEGAVVVQYVQMRSAFEGHTRTLVLREAVADPDGSAKFDDWGPFVRTGIESLDANAPIFFAIAKGYSHRYLSNDGEKEALPRSSMWNEQTVLLSRIASRRTNSKRVFTRSSRTTSFSIQRKSIERRLTSARF